MAEPKAVEDTSAELVAAEPLPLATHGPDDLAQLRTVTRHQEERICHLEQALDESLLLLRELRSQRVDQHFLESQLATTEETANVQQQAILHLKQQLVLLQQTLAEQSGLIADPIDPPSLDQAALPPTQGADPTEPGRSLPTVFQSQQQRMAVLEAESLSARVFAASLGVWLHQALTDVRELAAPLSDPSPRFHQLEARLQQALQHTQETLQRLPGIWELEAKLTKSPDSTAATESRSTHREELAIAQDKLTDLETEMARQISMQTLLQHANRELEQEREQQQTRITNLERQTADLQEQVLQQAQQATEYQTAIQHWKDRYDAHRSQVRQLSELLATILPQGSEEIIEILAALEDNPDTALAPGSPELFVSSAQNQSTPNPSTKLDLPDFLMQRRRYKARRSS